jgi:molecular chaperone HscB
VYCWKCQKLLSDDERFCPSCNIIQPLKDGTNYFELLGVEKQFLCDTEHLANQFRNLQRLYHPDKFASASEVSLKMRDHCEYFYQYHTLILYHLYCSG